MTAPATVALPPRYIVAPGQPTPEEARGGAVFAPSARQKEVWTARDGETLLDGPKDCGKTRAALELVHACMMKYPGARGLLARKTRKSLTQSAMVTMRERVFSHADKRTVQFHHGDQEYRYANGSRIIVGGLDDPDRLGSSEYDLAFIPEATECSLNDIEMVGGLLRWGGMPYARLILDCNPSYPKHWLNHRANTPSMRRLRFRHVDNPSITPARLAILQAMTGVRRKRLYEGLWVAAEGSVYEDAWDPAENVIDWFMPPRDWRRWWVVDFGFNHPFVWQAWAEDHDSNLYMYREIYRSKTLVEDHAKRIAELTENDPLPDVILCDHDAEDRATLERHLGMMTRPAWKPSGSVRIGIDAVASRMRPAANGKRRLFVMRGALDERDDALFGARGEPLPSSTEEEAEAYMWNPKTDAPVKEHDHGMDAMRYLVCHVDRIGEGGYGTPVELPDDYGAVESLLNMEF